MAVTTRNGDLSITCFMGSISLWGVGRLNDAHSKGRTRVQLTIKIWRTLPSKAQSVCPAAGMNLFGGAAERQPQWPRVFQLDLPECRRFRRAVARASRHRTHNDSRRRA